MGPWGETLQPPLFRKESTSELTAKKTKGSDRLFTTKLGLSQSLMVQEGTHNLNVTLNITKDILGFVLSEKSQNTTNHTISPQK